MMGNKNRRMNTPKGDGEVGSGLELEGAKSVQASDTASAPPGRDVHTSYPTAKKDLNSDNTIVRIGHRKFLLTLLWKLLPARIFKVIE